MFGSTVSQHPFHTPKPLVGLSIDASPVFGQWLADPQVDRMCVRSEVHLPSCRAQAIPSHDVSASIGFGCIEQAGSPTMTVRLQIGGTQIYWLADTAESEGWSAYEEWKRVESAPR